jgi:6-pyruvoyltetrahydropterin/6-carboxytetrahydropterin synthase
MFELNVERHFEAAHQLTDGEQPIEPLHGHTWKVMVTYGGRDLDKNGVAADFIMIRAKLEEILKQVDHQCLNDLPHFQGQSPSAEVVAQWIYKEMKQKLHPFPAHLYKVTVWEEIGCSATYFEDRS